MFSDDTHTVQISVCVLDAKHFCYIKEILNSLGETEVVANHDFSRKTLSNHSTGLLVL
jgi:hypothetical protein